MTIVVLPRLELCALNFYQRVGFGQSEFGDAGVDRGDNFRGGLAGQLRDQVR